MDAVDSLLNRLPVRLAEIPHWRPIGIMNSKSRPLHTALVPGPRADDPSGEDTVF